MMKSITLTDTQKTALVPSQTALASAKVAYYTAVAAYQADLALIAAAGGVPKRARLMLSDDGNSLIAQ
jgi:hypothetical protein